MAFYRTQIYRVWNRQTNQATTGPIVLFRRLDGIEYLVGRLEWELTIGVGEPGRGRLYCTMTTPRKIHAALVGLGHAELAGRFQTIVHGAGPTELVKLAHKHRGKVHHPGDPSWADRGWDENHMSDEGTTIEFPNDQAGKQFYQALKQTSIRYHNIYPGKTTLLMWNAG